MTNLEFISFWGGVIAYIWFCFEYFRFLVKLLKRFVHFIKKIIKGNIKRKGGV